VDAPVFIAQFVEWAADHPAVRAAALVGSWARGAAHAGSDIDLILIVTDPADFLQQAAWLNTFGVVERVMREDWGLVQSRRVYYQGGPEVEFGITTAEWAGTSPVDAGTARVVHDGLRILVDPDGLLADLLAALAV
jgi:hypothetical protein